MNPPQKDADSLFKNKYRSESARLKGYDYSSEGAYFITICTKNRIENFGEIRNGIMGLNQMGCLAARFWQEIPDHFTNVILDAWVVMPNHLHGIVFLNGHDPKPVCRDVALQRLYSNDRNNHHPTPTSFSPEFFSSISPKPKSISTIVRSFKSMVTKTINQNHPEINFAWQPRFHDRIIRNEEELNRIRQYIFNNPLKWELDQEHPTPLFLP